jgi:hypothetical protein
MLSAIRATWSDVEQRVGLASAAGGRGNGYAEPHGRWEVQPLRCYEMGLLLRGLPEPPPQERLSNDPHLAVWGEFLAAAVCHATNWNTLRRGIAQFLQSPPGDASTFAQLSLHEFETGLGHSFTNKLRMSARHRMFVEVATQLASGEISWTHHVLTANPSLAGDQGIYSMLDSFPTFNGDPERKKARILVQELCRTGLMSPTDPENLRPAVEYHIMRLYLRTERVVTAVPTDVPRLTSSETFRVDTINRLRRAVEEAMVYTAAGSGHPLHDLNHYEWQLARSYCLRESPRCHGPAHPKKPCDSALANLSESGACPLAESCRGSQGDPVSALREPVLSTRHSHY